MKKIISIILTVVLLTSLFAVSANASHWTEDEYSVDEGGNYHPSHAWGYVFDIDSVDYNDGDTTSIFTSQDAYLGGVGNAKWKAHVELAPTEEKNVYVVTAVYEYVGCSAQETINGELISFNDGKIVLVASDSGTRPDVDENGELLFPNWEDRAACWALANTIGAKLTLEGVELEFGMMPEDVVTLTVENDPDKVVDVSEQESADENTSGEVSVDASDAANGESDTSDVSGSTAKESSAFEKVFQVLFIVIMTVGVLGLPFYFWLNSKKKKALQEAEESDDELGNKEE